MGKWRSKKTMRERKFFKKSKTATKATITTGVILFLASIVLGGLLGYYMRSTQTINVETLGEHITINGEYIPYSETLVWNVSAGDIWNCSYNVSSTFSKPVDIYFSHDFTEESLDVSFYNTTAWEPISMITVYPDTFVDITVHYEINFLTTASSISGTVLFNSTTSG